MKKSLLLFLMIFLGISAASQHTGLVPGMNPFNRKKDAGNIIDEKHGLERSERFGIYNLRQVRDVKTKTETSFKHVLDSIYGLSFSSFTEQMEPAHKRELTFEVEGDLITESAVDYMWSQEAEQWFAFSGGKWTYDTGNNIREIIDYSLDDDEQELLPWMRMLFTYDNGNIILIEHFEWDEIGEEWYATEKEEGEYDNGNLVKVTYSQRDDQGEWSEYEYDEYEYDNDGNLATITYYEYDWDLETWEPIEYDEYEIDNEGNVMQITYYEYDWDEEEFIPYEKWEFVYNAEGKVTEDSYFSYNPDEEDWEYVMKTEYSYDASGNLTEQVNLHEVNGDLVPWDKYELTYDTDINIDEVLMSLLHIFWYEPRNMLTSIGIYEFEDDMWVQDQENIFYYSDYDPDPDPETFTLTITIEGDGTVEVNGTAYTGAMEFEADTEVTLEAIPDTDREFESWSGDLTSDDATATITMTEDMEITATFAVVTLSPIAERHGTEIFPNPFSNTITVTNAGNVNRAILANILGQTVREIEISGSETMTIMTDDLANGIYFFILQTDTGKRQVVKMVKN